MTSRRTILKGANLVGTASVLKSQQSPPTRTRVGFNIAPGKSRRGGPMMLRENEPTTIKLSTSVTGGQFVIFESTTSPGNGPRLHKHHDQDEWWYVLDGEFIFQIGEEKFRAKPGTVLKRRTPGVRILEDPQTRQVTKALTGADEFLNFCLISTMQWLEQNPTLTRELTKAMVRTLRWVHSHKPEEVRDPLPSSLRTQDKERHLESLRILMDGTSKDGRMPPEAPAGVLRYVGVTNEKVRNAKIDLSATYTNQFIEEANR